MGVASGDAVFRSALGVGLDWRAAAEDCLSRLDPPTGANLGFVYLADELAGQSSAILQFLAEATGIRAWSGTVGIGVCGTGREVFDGAALSVLAARLPEDSFYAFSPIKNDLARLHQAAAPWLKRQNPVLGVVHADPRLPDLADLLPRLADMAGGYLVGGLSSSRAGHRQIGGEAAGTVTELVAQGSLAGVLISRRLTVLTGVTQGCAPIGPVHRVTDCEDSIIREIDGRPALEVFRNEIGAAMAGDLRKVAGVIFAALPISGSDTGDYRVRNLIGIDVQRGWIAIGDQVEEGQPILFARRDRAGATADLTRMLRQVKRRLPGPPQGALYFSCVARGPNLFGEDSEELGLIERELGSVPLAGFFANGEISRDQLYGYTGVLTVFA